MSHFSVLVVVSPERLRRHGGDVGEAVGELMAPYQENNMGDCPAEFLVFRDIEDEERQKYEAEGSDMVRMPDGSLRLPWDEAFRVPGTFGTHRTPDGLTEESVPFRERYATFEAHMSDWCGHKARDEKAGRFGYWENPNAKWDYWRIGGCWRGTIPAKPGRGELLAGRWDSPEGVKPNTVDICRVADVDMSRVASEMASDAEKFWSQFEVLRREGEWLDEKGEVPFYGPRSTALDLGLCTVVQDGSRTDGHRWGDRWSAERCAADPERANWRDVYSDIARGEFLLRFMEHFSPLRTYAAVDDSGWHEAGRMGWFGCSHAGPEAREEYARGFHDRFVHDRDPETVLVVVDCHI